MPRNVEIKARARDFEHQLGLAAALSGVDSPPIDQVDTFYHCTSGRLKLRRFVDGSGELIQYHRADSTGARVSDYLRYPVADPEALHVTLAAALGVRGTVRKRRHLFRIGRTRVHVDEVEGLGRFIELEVVMREGESQVVGEREAERLAAALEIEEEDRLATAYIDLLVTPADGGVSR